MQNICLFQHFHVPIGLWSRPLVKFEKERLKMTILGFFSHAFIFLFQTIFRYWDLWGELHVDQHFTSQFLFSEIDWTRKQNDLWLIIGDFECKVWTSSLDISLEYGTLENGHVVDKIGNLSLPLMPRHYRQKDKLG